MSGLFSAVESLNDENLIQIRELAEAEYPLDWVESVLGYTVKGDTKTALILLYECVLTYSEDYQVTMQLNAPSSTGKTYEATEVLKYFPKSDIVRKGETSPSAYFHENKNLVKMVGDSYEPLEGKEEYIDNGLAKWLESSPKTDVHGEKGRWETDRKREAKRLKEEWKGFEKCYIADFERKILFFLDQPSDALLQKLRPMLSHDAKLIPISITGKEEGAHQTKHILLRGYPTVIYNSVSYSKDEQERTRVIQLSPSTTQSKMRQVLDYQKDTLGDKQTTGRIIDEIEDRNILYYKISLISKSPVCHVVIDQEIMSKLLEVFLDGMDRVSPRALRDYPRLVDTVRACALFNQFTRKKIDNKTIRATVSDMEDALRIMAPILESTRLGLSPYVWKFYNECLRDELEEGVLTIKAIMRLHSNFYGFQNSEGRIKSLLLTLENAGMIFKERDPLNKTRNIYTLTAVGVKKVSD
jgi:hypothetical protein